MATVQAIQCSLQNHGVVLFPGSPEKPPKYIDDKTLVDMQLRTFLNPNYGAPVFYYNRDDANNRWVFVKKHDGTN